MTGCTSLIFVNPGTKTEGCYYCDVILMQHMIPSILLLLVMLMYSSKTEHQRIVRVRRSSSFSMKLQNSLFQT